MPQLIIWTDLVCLRKYATGLNVSMVYVEMMIMHARSVSFQIFIVDFFQQSLNTSHQVQCKLPSICFSRLIIHSLCAWSTKSFNPAVFVDKLHSHSWRAVWFLWCLHERGWYIGRTVSNKWEYWCCKLWHQIRYHVRCILCVWRTHVCDIQYLLHNMSDGLSS